jgi:D-alanyl-lipoteichoic acid acyltransferase DltB (MBOAT superfamily)
MIFNSLNFALFFVVVLTLYWALPVACRWVWLLACSLFFYGYALPAYTAVPAVLAIITYAAALRMQRTSNEVKRQQLFNWTVAAIVAVLVFFKYTNFFAQLVSDALGWINVSSNGLQQVAVAKIIAPLGISYLTFQCIGYLIEVKRQNLEAEQNFGHLCTYLYFFPKLVAGPVERAQHFLPQIKQHAGFNYDNFSSGAQQLLWGLFKKLVVADRLAIYVNAVYNNHEHHNGSTLAIASVIYVFQIYTDFSGYTDIALGTARMLGYELQPNFNYPLLAKSVTEFWRKWHMSLSTWFADYFFGPLAIAKRDWGKWAPLFATFVTFVVLGFWHGANFTYIIFGALQGIFLSIELLTRKSRKNWRKKMPTWLNDGGGILITFLCFTFSSIFFRADSTADALQIVAKIFTAPGSIFKDSTSTMAFIALGILFTVVHGIKNVYFNTFSLSTRSNILARYSWYCLLIVLILAAGVFDGGEFIYFQF